MKYITQYAVQNYVITPAANSVNQPAPRSISEQKWQLTLSGVAIAEVKCSKNNDWSTETLKLYPDMRTPIQYAINNFGVPIPADFPYVVSGALGTAYFFQVEQYTIVAALGSVYDQNTAVNAGFAVNSWRPVPFSTLSDSRPNGTAPTLQRIFEGVLIDIAVRDIDAYLYRVNYQINLLGKIVFAKSVI